MRGVGKNGSKWNVRYDVKGYTNPVGRVYYRGAVHLANNGTNPHWIAPRNSAFGRGGRNGAFALYFPDGNVRWGPVWHPGTSGKKFFERAEPIVVAQSERIIKQGVRSSLYEIF